MSFARVENGVTKFSPEKTPYFGPNFFQMYLVIYIYQKHKQQFQFEFAMGKFQFLGRGRANLGGGYNFKTG